MRQKKLTEKHRKLKSNNRARDRARAISLNQYQMVRRRAPLILVQKHMIETPREDPSTALTLSFPLPIKGQYPSNSKTGAAGESRRCFVTEFGLPESAFARDSAMEGFSATIRTDGIEGMRGGAAHGHGGPWTREFSRRRRKVEDGGTSGQTRRNFGRGLTTTRTTGPIAVEVFGR